jgi:hypothetical protein
LFVFPVYLDNSKPEARNLAKQKLPTVEIQLDEKPVFATAIT